MITTVANPGSLGCAGTSDGVGPAAPRPSGALREMAREDTATTLLLAAGSGSRAALEQLYRLTAPRLLGVALRLLHDRAAAEDVLQECFVTVWQRADAFRAERASAMTWMHTIVRHRCLDRLRSRPRETTLDDAQEYADRVANLPDGRPGPEQRLADAQTRAATARAIERLPAHYRQALTLAYRTGLTHSEIAAHLGVPLGTAKSWVRRGLEEIGRDYGRPDA